jgi:hypothetical protein
MDGTGDHHVKQSKQGSEIQRLHVFSHMSKIDLKDKHIHKYKHNGTQTHTHTDPISNSGTV